VPDPEPRLIEYETRGPELDCCNLHTALPLPRSQTGQTENCGNVTTAVPVRSEDRSPRRWTRLAASCVAEQSRTVQQGIRSFDETEWLAQKGFPLNPAVIIDGDRPELITASSYMCAETFKLACLGGSTGAGLREYLEKAPLGKTNYS